MKRLSITYRATLEHHVPIAQKQRAARKANRDRGVLVFIRERLRHA